tara:strand:+ start:1550 stop:2437 length:888 start_codon:yes stop_codon:yes gene_type:complete
VGYYTNKVAVVTGAGSGLGRALALDLGTRGAKLAVSDINGETVAETARLLDAAGVEVLHRQLDVSDGATMRAHAAEVNARFGVIHQIYNNAGLTVGEKPLVRTKNADFLGVFRVNLWGVIHGTRTFLPYLIESGAGLVCNISSINGFLAMGQASAYSASKFAVRGFTESVQVEMLDARHPVQVSLVLPGGIATNIVRMLPPDFDQLSPERQAQVRHAIDLHYETMLRMSPEAAAKKILDRVARGRWRILITPRAFWLDLLVRAFPGQYPRLVAGFQRRFRARQKAGPKGSGAGKA